MSKQKGDFHAFFFSEEIGCWWRRDEPFKNDGKLILSHQKKV